MIAKLLKCWKAHGCWNKAGLANTVSSAISQSWTDSGSEVQPPVTLTATVSGYIPAGNGIDDGNLTGTAIWGYANYDATTYGAVPNISEPVNPQCDGDGNTIGTLVISPNLPENAADTFDLTFEVLDNSGGLGAIFAFCPDTGETTPLQGLPGSFGNNSAPVTITRTFDISALPCAPDEVLVGINAWGVSGSYADDRCDELNPLGETLVVVTPSKADFARQCFKDYFCFYPEDLLPATHGDEVSTVKRTERCVWEYDVAFNGTVLATRGNGAPALVVAAPAGSDYTFTFAPAPTNGSIHVEVAGDINTGDSSGINANAFIPQNVQFTSANTATATLYSGDDGGGADDEGRRAMTVFIHYDCEVVEQVLVNGTPV